MWPIDTFAEYILRGMISLPCDNTGCLVCVFRRPPAVRLAPVVMGLGEVGGIVVRSQL